MCIIKHFIAELAADAKWWDGRVLGDSWLAGNVRDSVLAGMQESGCRKSMAGLQESMGCKACECAVPLCAARRDSAQAVTAFRTLMTRGRKLLFTLACCAVSSHGVCRYKEAAHMRYAGWTTQECTGRECLLVHAQAGLEVDLAAVRQLVQRKLPGLLAGQSVQDLAEPWPPAD
jgi:hypothetical protein